MALSVQDPLIIQVNEQWIKDSGRLRLTLFEGEGPRAYTGADLSALAMGWAARLQQAGLGQGDRLALVLPTSEAFLGAFFGAWMLGATVVPLAPPTPGQDPEHEALRLFRTLAKAEPRLAITPHETRLLLPDAPCLLLTPDELPRAASDAKPPADPGGGIIQFSSGSTGHPKGAVLGWPQLLANARAIRDVLEIGPRDVIVSWLPMHHDMGLIGTLLTSQVAGCHLVLMPSQHFIQRPIRWLKALSDFGGTLSVAPNFAYQLCTRLPASQLAELDLSRWRSALVGAEPVRAATLRAFAERMEPQGFDPSALAPTYGLAEATLAVAMTRPGVGMRVERLARSAYEEHRSAIHAEDLEAAAQEIVCVGPPMPGVTLAIRDEGGADLPERAIGEIWVQSPSLMDRYLGDSAASQEALQGGFLRTGDLGYLSAGHLYVTGRVKDLIIRGGCKYHPQDLESSAEALPEVRNGGAIAFSYSREFGAPEHLVMLVETRLQEASEREALHQAVRTRIMDDVGLRVDEVILLPARSLPKTTSGKVRRAEARRLHLESKRQLKDA